MKRNRPVSVLAAGFALLFLLSACSIGNHAANESSSSQMSSSGVSSQVSSQSSSEGDPASGDPSNSAAPQDPDDSQPGRVLDITTDNKKFDQKFSENPIDKAYIKESDEAVSTVDMVNVSQKYAELWQKEIDHAWSELSQKMATDSSKKPAALKAEQQKWEDGKEAALKKIADDAYSAGGSMAEVNAASQKMDFYRSRAAQLYRELYDYEAEYSYAYSAK